MSDHRPRRILAIEVRRSRFGYALFEGPKRLLDWGASALPPNLSGAAAVEAARKRARSVLRRGSPTAIVVRRPRKTKTGPSATQGLLHGPIFREARALRIPIDDLNRGEIDAAFQIAAARSKEQFAWTVVGVFPELIDRLPPKRKKSQHEPRVMVIFDAVAIGFAYWLKQGAKFEIPDQKRAT